MEFIEWEYSFLFLRKKDKKIRIDAVQKSLTGLEDVVGPYIIRHKNIRNRALVLIIKQGIFNANTGRGNQESRCTIPRG